MCVKCVGIKLLTIFHSHLISRYVKHRMLNSERPQPFMDRSAAELMSPKLQSNIHCLSELSSSFFRIFQSAISPDNNMVQQPFSPSDINCRKQGKSMPRCVSPGSWTQSSRILKYSSCNSAKERRCRCCRWCCCCCDCGTFVAQLLHEDLTEEQIFFAHSEPLLFLRDLDSSTDASSHQNDSADWHSRLLALDIGENIWKCGFMQVVASTF